MFKGPVDSPFAVLCARVSDGCAVDRRGTPITAKDGMGWIHDLRKHPRARRTIPTPSPTPEVNPFIAELADEFRGNLKPGDTEMLAGMLEVAAEGLERLDVGWVKQYIDKRTGELVGAKAWAFPMRDDTLGIVGVRLRNSDGHKWAVKGSLNGLFIPRNLRGSGPLLIVEGPTETAAILDMGFDVIGRPGNTAGLEYLVRYCRRKPPRDIVILRNNDPAGSAADRLTRMGADKLARQLLAAKVARSVRIIAPPKTKDARDWKRSGATKAVIEAVIRSTPLFNSQHRPRVATPAHGRGLRANRVADR
jgi:hypothetical protein